MNLAPMILFVYNRPWHTRQTVAALQKNELANQSDLIIFSDGPKDTKGNSRIHEVRNYIHAIAGFKRVTIHERRTNKGLADNIINGVGTVIAKHGKAIILEDDLVSSPNFLRFMNKALDFYRDNKKVSTISGYNYPPSIMKIPAAYPYNTYFSCRNSSWGWATWDTRWEQTDWNVSDFSSFISDKKKQKHFNRGGDDLTDLLAHQMAGKVDSWSIRWTYSQYKQNTLSLYPVHSYINNIGLDGSGEHCGKSNKLNNNLSHKHPRPVFPPQVEVDGEIASAFANIYKKNIYVRTWHFIKQVIKKNSAP